MGRKKNQITITGETGVTIQTEEFLPEQEKAELFKQRPVEGDPRMEELFGNIIPGSAESEAELLDRGGDIFPSAIERDATKEFMEAPEPGTIQPEPGTEQVDPEQTEVRPSGSNWTFPPPEPEPKEVELPQPGEEFPRIETHTETQTLKCVLTESEIKQAGERMARAVGEKKDHEDIMKSVVSQYKAKIDESIAVIGSEAERIRSGYEFRPVEVQVKLDHELGMVQKFRTDTFERLESRKMTAFEAQRKIKFS